MKKSESARFTVGRLRWILQNLADEAEVLFGILDDEPEISQAEPKFAVGQFVKVSPPGKNPWFGKVVEDSGKKLVLLANGVTLAIPEDWMEPA